jgi:HK97 gp10 family phage protein
MKATVTIKKNKDMEQVLKRFSQKAIDSVRNDIKERAQYYVPVDTGYLKSSIRLIQKFTVGSTVRYAGYQEYGTMHHPAHPYMRPAVDDVMRALPGELHDVWMESMR